MTALGSGLGKHASNAALTQLRAEALGLARVSDRPNVQAIKHASLAQIGPIHRDRKRADDIPVLPLDPVQCLFGDLRCLHRADLKAIALPLCPRSRGTPGSIAVTGK